VATQPAPLDAVEDDFIAARGDAEGVDEFEDALDVQGVRFGVARTGIKSVTGANAAVRSRKSWTIFWASAIGGATASAVRHLSPFHWIGLWLAVATSPPSAERCLTIIAVPGVVTTSRSMTSTPAARACRGRCRGPRGR